MSIFSHYSKFSKRGLRAPKGFTLVELLVVCTIIVVISGFILARQARFDSATLLRSLAYSVALSIRTAQVYGISVREVTQGSGVFAAAYGVYFNSATSYILFADSNNNGQRSSDGTEDVKVYAIGNGYRISKFCGTLVSTGQQHCSTDSSAPLTSLTAYFKRPNPDARFNSSASGETYSSIYIQVQANNDPDNTHGITVAATGQIAVLAVSGT